MSVGPRLERSDSIADDATIYTVLRRMAPRHQRQSPLGDTREGKGRGFGSASEGQTLASAWSSESLPQSENLSQELVVNKGTKLQWYSGLGRLLARPEQMVKATRYTLQMIDERDTAGANSGYGSLARQQLSTANAKFKAGGRPPLDLPKIEEFDAFMRRRLDVTETLDARAHNVQVLHVAMSPFDTEAPMTSEALTLAGELVSPERAEAAALAVREKIAVQPHTLEDYFPTPAMAATHGGRVCGIDGSSQLSWRSSPKYSWRVVRHVLARCEDKLAYVLVALCLTLLLQWGSLTAACVAAAIIDSSPIQPRGDAWRRALVESCRELVGRLIFAPTRSVEGLMILLAEAVLQRRIGPKTCETQDLRGVLLRPPLEQPVSLGYWVAQGATDPVGSGLRGVGLPNAGEGNDGAEGGGRGKVSAAYWHRRRHAHGQRGAQQRNRM